MVVSPQSDSREGSPEEVTFRLKPGGGQDPVVRNVVLVGNRKEVNVAEGTREPRQTPEEEGCVLKVALAACAGHRGKWKARVVS